MIFKHTLNNCIKFKIGSKKSNNPFVLTPTIHGYIKQKHRNFYTLYFTQTP